jgi:NAD(P)-dependent dehydrogenase (short-subunit alcohol dehydrogenase family)
LCLIANEMGAAIIATGRDEEKLKSLTKELKGGNNKYFLADLVKQKEIDNLVKNLPLLDGVVHSAGILSPYPVKFIDEEKLLNIQHINYFAPVLLMSKILQAKKLKNKSSTVFVSSIAAAQNPYFGGALYAGSKAALEAYCKTFSLENASKGMRANCVCPALVKTPIFDNFNYSSSEQEMKEYEKLYPLGFGEPADVANAIVYLLSDAAKWITGINLTLDGGYLTRHK